MPSGSNIPMHLPDVPVGFQNNWRDGRCGENVSPSFPRRGCVSRSFSFTSLCLVMFFSVHVMLVSLVLYLPLCPSPFLRPSIFHFLSHHPIKGTVSGLWLCEPQTLNSMLFLAGAQQSVFFLFTSPYIMWCGKNNIIIYTAYHLQWQLGEYVCCRLCIDWV